MTTQRNHTRIGLIAVVATIALVAVSSGGAAAVDPANAEANRLENVSNSTTGVNPPDIPLHGLISVRSTNENPVDSANISVIGPSTATIEATFPDEVLYNISEAGSYDVIVKGTPIKTIEIGSTDISPVAHQFNSSKLSTADNLNVTLNTSKDPSTTYGWAADDSLRITADTYPAFADIPVDTTTSPTTVDLTETSRWSTVNSSLPTGNTTWYLGSHIQSISVDGETVYGSGDDPLGGGGGDGSTDQTTLLIVGLIAAAAAIVLFD